MPTISLLSQVSDWNLGQVSKTFDDNATIKDVIVRVATALNVKEDEIQIKNQWGDSYSEDEQLRQYMRLVVSKDRQTNASVCKALLKMKAIC